MSNDMTLDSLMVKILGMVYPPLPMTQELRDLIIKLPVAINKERAAREATATQPVNHTTGGGNIANKDAEIKKLKATVICLQNQIKNTAKKGVNNSNNNNAEIQKLKSEKGQLAADVKRLEQALKNPNAPRNALVLTPRHVLDASGPTFAPTFTATQGGGLRNSHQTSSVQLQANAFVAKANTAYPAKAESGQQHITKTGSNMLPVTNLQPRFQNRAVSTPSDPRLQIYSTSVSGLYYQSTQNTNVFSGNEKQTIHPSRMGQMDESSVTKLPDPRLTMKTAEAQGKPNAGASSSHHSQAAQKAFQESVKRAVQKALHPDSVPTTRATEALGKQAGETRPSAATSNGQGGVLQQPASLNEPNTAHAARKALPSEVWKSKFGDLSSNPSSQGSQPASFDKAEKNDVQDPRLVDRPPAAAGVKRAASPSGEQDAAKKSKSDWGSQPAADDVVDKTAELPTQDPRLLDRGFPAPVKKRAASPTSGQDTAKKVKTDALEDGARAQRASNFVNKPEAHVSFNDNQAAKRLSQLNAEIERVEERYTEGKHNREPSRTSSDSGLDVSVANTTPRIKATQRIKSDPVESAAKPIVTAGDAKSSPIRKDLQRSVVASSAPSLGSIDMKSFAGTPSQQTRVVSAPTKASPPQEDSVEASPTQDQRRDSAIGTATASSQVVKVGDRKLTCMHCRFLKLDCNQEKPCQHCEAQKCVYVTCPYGVDCISAGCWYSHDPAESAADKTTTIAGVDKGTHV